MDRKDELAEAWAKVSKDEGFLKISKDHNIDEMEQKYMVSMVIGRDWRENNRCETLGIKYNYRPHRRVKANRDNDSHMGLFFLVKRILTEAENNTNLEAIIPQEIGKKPLEDVLSEIIQGTGRATDKVKAIESLVKLNEKTQNSKTLKPFERIWVDTIIPKLLQLQ